MLSVMWIMFANNPVDDFSPTRRYGSLDVQIFGFGRWTV
jgi:hypothetical protein